MTQAAYQRTVTVPIDRLTPYPGNAKIGDIPAILDSLRRNAQYRAAVVRETAGNTLTVLAGNNTLAAVAAHGPGDCGITFKRGRKRAPCGVCRNADDYTPALRIEVVTCDDTTARRVNLADNRTADLGDWDTPALAALLDGLDGDLDGTAYNGDEVKELMEIADGLTLTSTEFLAGLTAPEHPRPPAPTGPPSHNPFSDSQAPARPPQQPAPASLTPPLAPTAEAEAEVEEPPPAARPVPHSDGVHTGRAAYTGPGAPSAPDTSIPLPTTEPMVLLQWVFTLAQRDQVRSAITHAQTSSNPPLTPAAALAAVCTAYLAALPQAG